MSAATATAGFARLQALEHRYVMQTYARAPVEFVRGEGTRLWDADGREYLDFLAGISVCSLGHCHPRVVTAVREQAGKLMHVSNLFYTEPMVRLAERLVGSSLGGRVFFANSGAEANECAIKIARKHAHARRIADPEIVSFEGDFHGRTYGALSATPAMARSEDFAPMLPGFRSVPRGDAEAMRSAVGPRTAAVLIEQIQGEAGVYEVGGEALLAAREACDRSGALLILDEVQTGVGRTGSLWAFEQTPIRPDVISAAKALGGGLPVGACITTPEAGEVLEPGDHGSTFAGGALGAVAALEVLSIVDEPGFLRRVREAGAQLGEGLGSLEGVSEVRGRGLMLAAGLGEGFDAAAVASRALERGLVVNVPGPGTIRLLPPLTVSDEEIAEALEILGSALSES